MGVVGWLAGRILTEDDDALAKAEAGTAEASRRIEELAALPSDEIDRKLRITHRGSRQPMTGNHSHRLRGRRISLRPVDHSS